MKKIFTISIIFLCLCFITYAQIPTNGLVAYYPFNGNANDESGNGNNGVLHGSPQLVSDRSGNNNCAYYFNGSDAYITCPTNNFPINNEPRTISIWIKSPDMAVGNKMLLGWGLPSLHRMSALALGRGNNATRQVMYWGYGDDFNTHTILNDNAWYNIVYTYENGLGYFYVNGKLDTSYNVSPLTPDSTELYIANFISTMSKFNGTIDDIRIYKKALNSSEIVALYTEENYHSVVNPNISLSATMPFIPNLVSYFYDRSILYDFNRLVIEIDLNDLRTTKTPLHNLNVKAYYGGKLMKLLLNTSKFNLDTNGDSTIDIFPAINNVYGLQFLAMSDSLTSNQINKLLELKISSIDGNQTSIDYKDTVSYYFAKSPNNIKAFSLSRDAYSFEDLSSLSSEEIIYILNKSTFFSGPNGILNGLIISYLPRYEDGRCYGMAATAGTYFLDPSKKPFINKDVFDYDSTQVLVADNITNAYLIQNYYNLFNNFDLSVAYNNLLNELMVNHPVLLNIKNKNEKDWHVDLGLALTTFKNQNKGYISLYENHFPAKNYTATINLKSSTFSYSQEDQQFDQFSTVPFSVFLANDLDIILNKFISKISSNLLTLGQKIFSVFCPVNLMLQNSRSQKVGYDSLGVFHNDIPGAQVKRSPTSNSPNDSLTTIYVPANDKYIEKIYGNGNGYMHLANYSATDTIHLNVSYIDSIYITPSTICSLNENNSSGQLEVDRNSDGIIDSTVQIQNSVIASINDLNNKQN